MSRVILNKFATGHIFFERTQTHTGKKMVEYNKEIIGHFPCPICGSKDNLVKYRLTDYGVTSHHCYTPNCTNSLSDEAAIRGIEPKPTVFKPRELECKALAKRNLTKTVCKEYGVMVDAERSEYVFPYYNSEGQPIARKMRNALEKKFYWEGDNKSVQFFGFNTVTSKRTKLVITEGEFDALAARQMLDKEYTVLSIPNGAGSAKDFIKKHLKFVETFKSIYLCFDNDSAGETATDEVMSIIRKGQAYRVQLQYKDANEYLTQHTDNLEASRLFKSDFEKAKQADYDGIVSQAQVASWLLEEMSGKSSVYEGIGLTGIPDLDKLFTLRKSELTTVFADPSVGKSSAVRWIVKNLIQQEKQVLILALEETPREWVTKVAGMLLGRPIIGCLGESKVTDSQAKELAERVSQFARVSTINGAVSVDELRTLIEYSVRADGTELVVLDNITAACADDAQVATRLSQTLSTMLQLSKEFGHHSLVVSHTKRRESKDRKLAPSMFDGFGSGSIERFSHNVISLARDVQNDDQTITIRIVKQRATGKLGECELTYIPKTGCFVTTTTGDTNDGSTNNEQIRLESRRPFSSEAPDVNSSETTSEDILCDSSQDNDPRLCDNGESTPDIHRVQGVSETGMGGEDGSFRHFRQTTFTGVSSISKTYCEPFNGSDYWGMVEQTRLYLDD